MNKIAPISQIPLGEASGATARPRSSSNSHRASISVGPVLAKQSASSATTAAKVVKIDPLDQVLKEAGIAKNELDHEGRKFMKLHTRDYLKFLLFQAGDLPFDRGDCESLDALKQELARLQAVIAEKQEILDTPTEQIMQHLFFKNGKQGRDRSFCLRVTGLALGALGTIALIFTPSSAVSSDSTNQYLLDTAKLIVTGISGMAASLVVTVHQHNKEKRDDIKRTLAENIKSEARQEKALAEKARDAVLEKIREKLREIHKKIDANSAKRLCLDYLDATPYLESSDRDAITSLTYDKNELARFYVQQTVLSSLIKTRLDHNLPLIYGAMKKYIPIEDSALQPKNLMEQFIAATGQICETVQNRCVDSMDIRTFRAEWADVQNNLLEKLRTIKQRTIAANRSTEQNANRRASVTRPRVLVDISFLDTQSNRNNLRDFPLSCLAAAPETVQMKIIEYDASVIQGSLEKKEQKSDPGSKEGKGTSKDLSTDTE